MMIEEIKAKIKSSLVNGQLPCTVAHVIAYEFGVKPLQVGQTADEMEVALSLCQLGCFGYGPKAEGKSKILRPTTKKDEKLMERLRSIVVEGSIPCISLWQIAAEFGLERLAVSNAAETLGLKIGPCQLGCF
ncbi:MAG: hypothetical protein E3J21_00350 [Anaerolineales bacterium]|nr:MAG: hypothetical protein E3J21_00350 [Anaerolineales bacterium]